MAYLLSGAPSATVLVEGLDGVLGTLRREPGSRFDEVVFSSRGATNNEYFTWAGRGPQAGRGGGTLAKRRHGRDRRHALYRQAAESRTGDRRGAAGALPRDEHWPADDHRGRPYLGGGESGVEPGRLGVAGSPGAPVDPHGGALRERRRPAQRSDAVSKGRRSPQWHRPGCRLGAASITLEAACRALARA